MVKEVHKKRVGLQEEKFLFTTGRKLSYGRERNEVTSMEYLSLRVPDIKLDENKFLSLSYTN